MADAAVVPSSTTITPGPVWVEFTNAANIVLNASGTNSGATVVTIGIPTTGAAATLTTANTIIAACAMNQANVNGAKGTGLPAGIGIANMVWTNSVDFTLTFVNTGAATNINANTRFVAFVAQGV